MMDVNALLCLKPSALYYGVTELQALLGGRSEKKAYFQMDLPNSQQLVKKA
jgi:hypothetical protein